MTTLAVGDTVRIVKPTPAGSLVGKVAVIDDINLQEFPSLVVRYAGGTLTAVVPADCCDLVSKGEN